MKHCYPSNKNTRFSKKKMKNEKCETKLQTDLLEGEIFINKKSQK